MSVFEKLEPRILLSADLLPVPAESISEPLGFDHAPPLDQAEAVDFSTAALVPAQPLPEDPGSPEAAPEVLLDGEPDQQATPSGESAVVEPGGLQPAGDENPLENSGTIPGEVTIAPGEETIAAGDATTAEHTLLPAEPTETSADADTPATEIVFVNDDVEDSDQLLEGLSQYHDGSSDESHVFVLDSSMDGFTQVSDILSGYDQIDAVHFFTHGTEGNIKIGSDWLNKESVAAHSDQISSWNDSLQDNGDLLFYGCNVAATPESQEFLADIAELTSVDIAASTDTTGHQAQGGDWILEYQLGEIETAVPLPDHLQDSWQHIMAAESVGDDFDTIAYNNNNGTVNWTGDWTEVGDDADPSTGTIYIDTNRLHIITADKTEDQRAIFRAADLSSAASAFISFDYEQQSNLGNKGFVQLQIRTAGASTWDNIGFYEIKASETGTVNIDITSYISNDTEIQFTSTGTDFGGLSKGVDEFFVDDLRINFTTNEAPTATNLSLTESYTEDTPIDLTDIVITDVDGGSLYTATLTLSDTAAGTFNTATVGTASSSFASGVLTVSGTGLADVNTLLAGVTFTPTLNYDSDFTIATSVTDGYSAPITGTRTMNAIAVNDAPTATNLSLNESYTEDTPIDLTDIVITDVDGGTLFTATLTLSDTAAGSFNTATLLGASSSFASGVLTVTGTDLADVNTLLAGVTFTPTLNYNSDFTIATSVSDGIAAITGTKTMIATGISLAPTATNLTLTESYTEDTPIDLTDIVITDVDGGSLYTATLTLSDTAAGSFNTATLAGASSSFASGVLTVTGTDLADVNTLLAGVTFTPTLNYDSDFTIATSVTDGDSAAITGTRTMNGITVYDAPTATNLSLSESYTEDTPKNLTDIVITDVDGGSLYTATLTLSDTAAGSFNTATLAGASSSFASGVLTVTGTDLADVNTLLAGVTFTPTLNYDSDFTIATSVTDGDSAAITGTRTMNAIAVNDGLTATNLFYSETFTEDTAHALRIITVTDPDSPESITATLTLADPLHGSLSTTSGGTFNAATGEWQIIDTVANVNAAFATLTYNPAANFSQDTSIDVRIKDGLEDGAPAQMGIIDLTAIPVGDTPTANSISTDAGVMTGSIFILPNPNDGPEVTHFQIINITNGSLFLQDGITPINNNDFITLAQGSGGVKFLPAAGVNGSFGVQSSEDGATVAAQSGVATSLISINAPATGPPEPPEPEEPPPIVDSGGGDDTGVVDPEPDISPVDDTLIIVTGQPPVPSTDPTEPGRDITEQGASPTETADEAGEAQEETASSGEPSPAAPTLGAGFYNATSSPESFAGNLPQNANPFSTNLEFRNIVLSGPLVNESREFTVNNSILPDGDNVIFPMQPADDNLLNLEFRQRMNLEYDYIKNSLDAFREETQHEGIFGRTVVGSAIAASTGLSAGYVIWLLRSGALISSLLSSLPAWQFTDPLAVLAGRRREEEEQDEDDSLESIAAGKEKDKEKSVG